MWFHIPVTGAAEVQLRIFALFVTISHVVEEILVGTVVYLHLGMSKMEIFNWLFFTVGATWFAVVLLLFFTPVLVSTNTVLGHTCLLSSDAVCKSWICYLAKFRRRNVQCRKWGLDELSGGYKLPQSVPDPLEAIIALLLLTTHRQIPRLSHQLPCSSI